MASSAHLMLALVVALTVSSAPVPELKSLQGLNVAALKPWLQANLPSLGKCTAAGQKDEVTVKAEFASGPDVKVLKVEAAHSDVQCVKAALEAWKNDGHQPRAGPFSLSYTHNMISVR